MRSITRDGKLLVHVRVRDLVLTQNDHLTTSMHQKHRICDRESTQVQRSRRWIDKRMTGMMNDEGASHKTS